MPRPLLILLIGFGLVVLLGFLPGLRDREFKGWAWKLFRVFFPSWRFFQELGSVPVLRFKILENPGGEWIRCLEPAPRGWGSLFLNAKDNLRMAANSLVEQLIDDMSELQDEDEVESSVSYELVTRLVRFRIREARLAQAGQSFQFKVTAVTPGTGEKNEGEDLLISAAHRV